MDGYTITVITTPAPAFNLTTLLAVLADLAIDDSTSQEKVRLERLIRQCSSAVAKHCNRIFALQTYTETVRPSSDAADFIPNTRELIQTRHYPIVQVTSIREADVLLTPAVDYEIDAEFGQIRRLNQAGNPRSWPAQKIVIVYSAGWILPGWSGQVQTLPDEIEQAVIRLIKFRDLARERDGNIKAETVDGVGSIEYRVAGEDEGDIPPDIADALTDYRIPSFA